MDGDIVRICAVALVCSVGALMLKGINSQIGFALKIVGVIALFTAVSAGAARIFSDVAGIVDLDSLGRYAMRMLKALGLGFLCGMCADICRECGEGNVATGVEAIGNIAILSLCIPLFEELMGYAAELLSLG